MNSPEEWLKIHNVPFYRSYWGSFSRWLAEKYKIDWQVLMQKTPVEIRNILDEFLLEKSKSLGSASLKNANTAIRSFFNHNDIVLPKAKIKLRGSKPKTISKLTPKILGDMIMAAKPRDKSFLLFKFQSLQDNARMLWISKNGWSQIKPQLEAGGFTDKNETFWKDLLKIDIPLERKGNPNPYFCFIGKEAIEALKSYLDLKREPKKGELIWRHLGSVVGMQKMMLRLGQRINVLHLVDGGNTGTRYGLNLHEMRDVARSLWHESGADLSVGEFCMGHSIDRLGYDKIMTLSPDYAIKEFKKAEPYLSMEGKVNGETVRKLLESDQAKNKELEELKALVSKQNQRIEELAKLMPTDKWAAFGENVKVSEEVETELSKQARQYVKRHKKTN